MKIRIDFRMKGTDGWQELQLSPEEYFDLEPNEVPECNCVPRHNHACDYLKVPIAELCETRIMLQDDGNEQRVKIKEMFWNQGRNRLIERSDCGRKSNYRELILFGVVTEQGPQKLEILRFHDENGVFNLTFHSIIERNADGSETEQKFFP